MIYELQEAQRHAAHDEITALERVEQELVRVQQRRRHQ
jgi:hypothetical protein